MNVCYELRIKTYQNENSKVVNTYATREEAEEMLSVMKFNNPSTNAFVTVCRY